MIKIELHNGEDIIRPPDANYVGQRWFKYNGDPFDEDYSVDRYALVGVQDGVAHYKFHSTSTV